MKMAPRDCARMKIDKKRLIEWEIRGAPWYTQEQMNSLGIERVKEIIEVEILT